MPWEHCGNAIMDDSRCPDCGGSKGAWTLRFNKTRLFALSPTWPGDPEAQAEALKAAAKKGTPLCEECERYRKEQAEQQGAA